MDPLVVNGRVTLAADELHLRTSRAGGPGGQHVNKVETAVELRFEILPSASLTERDKEVLVEVLGSRLVGEDKALVVRSREHRSQRRNIDEARERMASLLREALRPKKKRRATKPTRGSQRRRLNAKKARGDIKKQRRRPTDD